MDQEEECQDNWDFDEDDLDLDDDDKNVNMVPILLTGDLRSLGDHTKSMIQGSDMHTRTRTRTPSVSNSKIEQDLVSYIQYLSDPETVIKVNKNILQGLSSPEKALQLCQYYYARPQLKSYTIHTELSRMNYTFILDKDTVLTTPEEIEQWYTQSLSPLLLDKDGGMNRDEYLLEDMLIRCSNQSLLVDLLEAITTEDDRKGGGLIQRKRFSLSTVATKCRFVVDLRNPKLEGYGFKRNVHIDCTFSISIPTPQDNVKLQLATVRCLVDFSPEPSSPSIVYSIVSIHSLLNMQASKDRENLHSVAIYLESMIHYDDEYEEIQTTSTYNQDILRDHFLQSLTTSTHRGITSALREIDHATNVSRKFQFLKSMAVSSLPDIVPTITTTLDDDYDESLELDKIHHPSRITNHDPSIHGNNSTTMEVSSRPKPVLGSLIMSGLKTLAKATTTIVDSQSKDVVVVEKKDASIVSSPLQVHGTDTYRGDIYDNVVQMKTTAHDIDHEEIQIHDGWDDDDDDVLLLDDEVDGDSELNTLTVAVINEINQEDISHNKQKQRNNNNNNIFSKVRDTMNNQEIKQFWVEAIQILVENRPLDDPRDDDTNHHDDHPLDIPKRKRYITRAERFGINVTF